LVNVQETVRQYDSFEKSKTQLLQSLIQKGSNTLQEIDTIINSALIDNNGTIISETAKWKLWLKYGTLQKVGVDLRRTRADITSALTLLTA